MNDGALLFSHEALAGRAHERDRFGKEDAHRVAEGDRLLVRATLHRHLAERRRRQVDRSVQRQGRELLALSLLDRLGLLLRELAKAPQQILWIPTERKAEAA